MCKLVHKAVDTIVHGSLNLCTNAEARIQMPELNTVKAESPMIIKLFLQLLMYGLADWAGLATHDDCQVLCLNQILAGPVAAHVLNNKRVHD